MKNDKCTSKTPRPVAAKTKLPPAPAAKTSKIAAKLPVAAPKPIVTDPKPTVRLELYAPNAREVFVAGSFNEWRPNATALTSARNGKWAGELALAPGRYEYLFLVDGQWLADPQSKAYAPNPFGGFNSLLEVG